MPDYLPDLMLALDITWQDSGTEQEVASIARRAEAYLSNAAGRELSFSVNMVEVHLLQLLFDCARYIRSHALDEFRVNYADELFALRADSHIAAMEQEELNGGETV